MDPRPYQLRAVHQVLDYALEYPTGRVLLVIPTRGGKTLVGALLVVEMAIRHGLRALWIVHREELLDEAVAHLIAAGIPASKIGVIKNGRAANPAAPVQVASDATLDHRTKPDAQLVVTDEAHRDTAPRRRRLRKLYPDAFLLGLTATPKPPPTRDLGEDYDTLMVVVQPSELIHDGYLAVPTVYAPAEEDVPDLRGVRIVAGDYAVGQLEPLLLQRSLLDEQVAEWKRLADGRRTIAYPVTIAHSTALVARFRGAGVDAYHLDGDTASDERRRILTGLAAGKIPLVSSVGVISEGTNIPSVKCILGVRPTRSLTLFTQQYMRCATPWNDVRPRALDVVGNVYRHGYPFADRRWSLKNADSGQAINLADVDLKRCACGAMMPRGAKTCAGCKKPFVFAPPVMPATPLDLREVSLRKAELTAERIRLLAFAKTSNFIDPEGWTARVLAAKHGAVG